MISCFALLRSMPSVLKSFKLSATSVSPTFGWKKIGASNSDKTESTPSNFDNDSSIWESWFNDWYEKSSNSGLKVTIKKLDSPNSFSFSLYVFNDSSPSKATKPELEQFYYNSLNIPGGYSESGYVQISDWDMVLKTAKSVLQVDENTNIITFSNNQKRKCTESSPVYYCKPLTEIELDTLNRIAEKRQALPSVYESW